MYRLFATRFVRMVLFVAVGFAAHPQIGAAPLLRFADVTEATGLEGLRINAAAWGDYDGDGWVDLYVNGDLWRNDRGRRFVRVQEAGLTGNGGLWFDFDNDGDLDLFCWGNHKLFRNRSGGGFEDVSDRVPGVPIEVSRGAVAGDWNGDRFLDLYLGGYEIWEQQKEFPDVLLQSLGGERFELAWQTPQVRRARGVTAADFNEDGNLDILVSNYRLQPNSLWIGSSEGTFQAGEVQKRIEVSTGPQHGHTIGSAWGDLDNDGHLDLFVGNFSHPRPGQDPPLFLKNLGPAEGFRFSDRTEAAALNWQESYASPVLGDFDNDGLLDLFLTAVYRNDHSVLYRNLGEWRFQDLTEASGIRTAETYQAACADFDNDGDLDLVSGGRLWRNELGDSNWLRVRLDGRTGGSRSAFGARITLRYGPKIQVRQIESATGEGNQSEETAHFGLGSFEGEVTLEIQWPDRSLQWISSPVNRLLLVRRSVHVRSQAKGDHWRGRSSGQ